MSLREEIDDVLTIVKKHALSTGQTKPRDSEIASVFMVIEKRIDKAKEQNLCTDVMMLKGYNFACDWIKELLK